MDQFKTNYVPILKLRPAEMNALVELPHKSKESFLPAIQLKPWMNSNKFENSLSKAEKSWDVDRPWIANLDREYKEIWLQKLSPKPATAEFQQLCNPDNGYENWVHFISQNANCIPTLQIGDRKNTELQASSLSKLGRGLVVHLNKPNQEILNILSDNVSDEVMLIADFEELGHKIGKSLPSEITGWAMFIQSAFSAIDRLNVAVSGTSFPSSFSDQQLSSQNIHERDVYNSVVSLIDANYRDKLIYSDRAGARIQPLSGGGGMPIRPRIDYSMSNEWCFFRSTIQNIQITQRDAEYIAMSKAVMNSDKWIEDLKIWGTAMIEKTANGDCQYGINSPVKSTTVRLNLHIHHQTFLTDQTSLFDTEDDWTD